MSKKHGFGKFLAGIGIGAAAGVLFAPKTGSETRKDLKKYISKLLDEAKNIDVDEVKNNIEAKIMEIKESIEELDKEKALEIAKKKVKQIKAMADELVDYAVEKGTPIIEETAETVREKTIDITKEILKKLEEK